MREKDDRTTVGKWIVNKVNTKDWRAGKVDGEKHYGHGNGAIHDIMEAVGSRTDFMKQINELAGEGLITVKRANVNTEIKEITFAVKDMDRLCEYEGVVNEKELIEQKKRCVLELLQKVNCAWLEAYGRDVYRALSRGILEKNVMDECMFNLLYAIAGLENDIWERKLSSDVLKDSKKFEHVYRDKVITVLRKYSVRADELMTNNEVLMEHRIMTYSQTLQFKGSIVYTAGNGEIDTGAQIYGTVLNAQTLSHARLVSLNAVKRIMTIENQANYEQMQFQPDVLYIYTHGFLSPKERRFLEQIEAAADSAVEFYHWSDLDYGGIRIFQFMKQNVFRRVKPYKMDRAAYEKASRLSEGFELANAKRDKLEKLHCEELEELRQCILTYGKEYEQEILIG